MSGADQLTAVIEATFKKVLNERGNNTSVEVANLISGMMDAKIKELANKTQMILDEQAVALNSISQKLGVITTLLGDGNKRKAIPKAATTAATPDPAAVKDAIEAGNIVVPTATSAKNVKTAAIYFRQQYLGSDEFRRKYALPADALAALRNDDSVKSRKTEKTKDSRVADLVFKYMNANCADLSNAYNLEYKTYKDTAAVAPTSSPQANVEAHTP